VIAADHRLGREARHFQWDRGLSPAATVRSGDVIRLETQEVSGGQVQVGAPAEMVARLDRSRFYPLTGPVYVEGAVPGNVLKVEMLEIRPGGWGWTANFPGRGLLPDDFPDPYIRYFDLDGRTEVAFAPGVTLPLDPFCGTIGVAADEAGPLPVRPPHAGGGNIDTRQLVEGSTLYLPVLVDGALLSVGDGHAAQGDGEVCLTAIECDLTVTVRLSLLTGHSLSPHTYQTLSAPVRDPSRMQRFGSSATGPDLMENARNAVRGLIDWLVRQHGLGREDAYLLCSLAADLHISQLVNDPNYGVTAWLPLSIFDGDAHG
jgi:acetamidase/formamidase